MEKCCQAVRLAHSSGEKTFPTERFGLQTAQAVRAFHQSFPGYAPTPLARLARLSEALGVSDIFVKDESFRFDLNAFKVLGGSYAIGRRIAQMLGMDMRGMTYEKLVSPEVREKLGEITFATATDGNHGRGVAWTANRLQQKSVVYMPHGTAPERLANIRALGARAEITPLNYDGAVRRIREEANENGWTVVQDTSCPGYEEIPGWIMEGYTTMALEAYEQLNGLRPTHIFLQAGVGSMAAAVACFFADVFGVSRPKVVIVEPDQADCLFRTARANDGKRHIVTGEMNTIMAGLACGEPCSIAWDVLRETADWFVSMPDRAAAMGMRILANPLGDDPRVISGESGASGFGLLTEILRREELSQMKNDLELGRDSRILCFSTEGDTDRANYRRIVWDGRFGEDEPETRE